MNKKLLAAGIVVLAVAAGSWPALVWYQAREFDRSVKTWVDKFNEVSAVRLTVTETARSFSSREFSVDLNLKDPELVTHQASLIARLNGHINFGWHIVSDMKTDTKNGIIIARITQDGKIPYDDDWHLNANWRGRVESIAWDIQPINYHDEKEDLTITTSAINLLMTHDGKDAKLDWRAPTVIVNERMRGFEMKGLHYQLQTMGDDVRVTNHIDTIALRESGDHINTFGASDLQGDVKVLEKGKDGKPKLATFNIDYKLNGLALEDVVTSDRLQFKLDIDRLPIVPTGTYAEYLQAWNTILRGFENGMTVTIPSLTVVNGSHVTELKMHLKREETTNGMSLGTIDLSFDPLAFGEKADMGKDLLSLVMSTDRKSWTHENGLVKAHWVLPYSYIDELLATINHQQ